MEKLKVLPVVLADGHDAIFAKQAAAIMQADTRARLARRSFGTAIAAMFGAFAGDILSSGPSLPLFARPLSPAAKAQIIGRLQAFYRQRPRPWRPASHRPRARRRGPVYDKLARRAA